MIKYKNRLKKVKNKQYSILNCPLSDIIIEPTVFVKFVINMAYPKQPFGISGFVIDSYVDEGELLKELHAGLIDLGYEIDSLEEALVSYLTDIHSESN